MLDNVRESRNRYFADLEDKRKTDEWENTMQKEAEDKKKSKGKKCEELQQVKASLALIQNNLVIADDNVNKGNKELKGS